MMINDYQMMIERKAQLKVIQRNIRDAEFRREALSACGNRRGIVLKVIKLLRQTHLARILSVSFWRQPNSQQWLTKRMGKG